MSTTLSPYAIRTFAGPPSESYTGTIGCQLGSSTVQSVELYYGTPGDCLGAYFFRRGAPMPSLIGPFSWNDPTTVPNGMAQMLTPTNIFVFGCYGVVPMGELFRTLRDNGAGLALGKLEALAVQVGYSLEPTLYGLISIPGSGHTGVENAMLDPYQSASYKGTSAYVNITIVAAQMNAEKGLYSPGPLWP